MVSSIQKEKVELFLKYHHDKEILVLLNSWDNGSSKLIEACGFKAIATTSMGVAASLGYPDCQIITLSEMIEVITGIVKSVKAPVTVDIEAGYGNNTNEVLESMKKIIATGIAGINIEDSLELDPKLIDEMEFCERISAIRELSESLGFHLVQHKKNYLNQLSAAINTVKPVPIAFLFSLYLIKKQLKHW